MEFWYCPLCDRVGGVPKSVEFELDPAALQRALNAAHRHAAMEPYADAGGKVVPICIARDVGHLTGDDLRRALLQGANLKPQPPPAS